ncbi:MAG: hypothetical protein ABIH00_03945 [Armatimonadota bacterium]
MKHTKNSVISAFILSLLLCFTVLVIYGCSSTSTGGSSTTSPAQDKGGLKIAVNWAEASKIIKAIPAAAVKIAIDIYKVEDETTSIVPQTLINRPGSSSTVSTEINGIPVGNIKLKAAALNSSGGVLATGNTTAVIKQGDNPSVTVALVERYLTYAWLATSKEAHLEAREGYAVIAPKTLDISRSIHCGVGITSGLATVPTVAPPPGNYYTMNTTQNPPLERIRGVYYAGYDSSTAAPELTVNGNIDLQFENSTYYSYDFNEPTFFSGDYTFNINNTNVIINNTMDDFCDIPSISSPTPLGNINYSTCTTVQWENLGTDYVYLIMARHETNTSTRTSDIFWTSNDWRSLSTADMNTFTNLINELSANNYCTIPGNIFTEGSSVKVTVIAINKTHYNVDQTQSIGRTLFPYGGYTTTYTVADQ